MSTVFCPNENLPGEAIIIKVCTEFGEIVEWLPWPVSLSCDFFVQGQIYSKHWISKLADQGIACDHFPLPYFCVHHLIWTVLSLYFQFLVNCLSHICWIIKWIGRCSNILIWILSNLGVNYFKFHSLPSKHSLYINSSVPMAFKYL